MNSESEKTHHWIFSSKLYKKEVETLLNPGVLQKLAKFDELLGIKSFNKIS